MAEVIKRIQDSAVTVGIHSDAGMHDESDGVTVAEIGAVNEFGSRDGHIHERSFMRSTINENRSVYTDAIAKIAKSAIQGKRDARDGMGLLGRKAEGDIKKKIRDIKEPGNADSTIAAKKGIDNPLVDSGQMVNSIRWKYEEQ